MEKQLIDCRTKSRQLYRNNFEGAGRRDCWRPVIPEAYPYPLHPMDPVSKEEILHASPVDVDFNWADHFDLFLGKFKKDDVVWIGNPTNSGKAEHAANFRRVDEWTQFKELPGPYISTSSFIEGSFSRRYEFIQKPRFFVVAAHENSGGDITGVIKWLHSNKKMDLVAIVSDGPNFWGWFRHPGESKARKLSRLLYGRKCNPDAYNLSSIFPLPGIEHNRKRYELVWLTADNQAIATKEEQR